MADIVVSEPILRAAKLFTERDHGRHMCVLPWAVRAARQNIVVASDGHTLFVASDISGSGYPRRPRQVGGEPLTEQAPDWPKIIHAIPRKRRAFGPVAVNPPYHARVMRAASILDIRCVTLSLGGSTKEVIYQLGPDAFAVVMPMFDQATERPVVPIWLEKAAGR